MNANYHDIIRFLDQKKVLLVAVSKTQPVDAIMELYNAGQRDFGENRVQEFREKQDLLPKDIHWHIIGHLQTNKVKYIAPTVALIHSVDSWDLLVEIDKQAKKHKRIIPCLLQIYIASEETKFGLSDKELYEILDNPNFKDLKNIRIDGLMGMASNSKDLELVRKEFKHLKSLFVSTKDTYFKENENFKQLSMGMSSDYTIAIEEGATMVRIGSLLF
ncbi:MAG: YggS family pyridoxal phosphate-dependent enzyme [Chitinophagales bacterium]|nr:YggS family pyridoxal phosphate-dependent enzyme [Bacteroidota bacterium]MBP8917601.1 YggS family pyridoxal phosphate-dependent enzyme [Chitinophagales bacterium]MBP9220450.1 YggS family pyridoxal phosphate-dependent enzyme [Chitinophagales bacterium]MBP9796998.1 YggS family pyridoxal phosphate-dependent enzyme [Chitinophagales bacterium]